MKLYAHVVGSSIGIVIEKAAGGFTLWGVKDAPVKSAYPRLLSSSELHLLKDAMPIDARVVSRDLMNALELSVNEAIEDAKVNAAYGAAKGGV